MFGYFIKNMETGLLYRERGSIYQTSSYEEAKNVALLLNIDIGYEAFKVIENRGE